MKKFCYRTNLAEGEGVYAQDSYTGSHVNIKVKTRIGLTWIDMDRHG